MLGAHHNLDSTFQLLYSGSCVGQHQHGQRLDYAVLGFLRIVTMMMTMYGAS